MMKKLIISLIYSNLFNFLAAIEPMNEEFLVHYGKPSAPLKVIEYFSFSCPHCVNAFKDFYKIKADFIDQGKIYFTFQAIPKDLTTIRALHCLSILNEQEKQIFLEALFEYLEESEDNADHLCKVMQDFISCFGNKNLVLDDFEALKQTAVMQQVLKFIKQEELVKALPAAEINGFLFPNEFPNYRFFSEAIQATLGDLK